MQDGCTFEKAQTEGQKRDAPVSARLTVKQTEQKGLHECG